MPSPSACILANGDFPTHAIPLSVLQSAEYLCCCDGAGMVAVAHGLTPDVIVGDGDSLLDMSQTLSDKSQTLPKDFQERYSGIFRMVTEQDDNDLTKATRFVCSLGWKRIAYVGATGRREDHTIANISLMAHYHRQLGVEPVMYTDHGWFAVVTGSRTFDTFPRQQVSIFNVDCTTMRSEGLRWSAYAARELWQTTLNEALGGKVTISGDGTFLVFLTYAAK